MKKIISAMAVLVFSATGVVRADDATKAPLYNVTIQSNSTKAINYRHLSGSTKIDFRGTPIAAKFSGEATVQSVAGATKINAEFMNLEPANKFGAEYMTYVLWSISPEGRVTNLGELILNKDKSEIQVTAQIQTFALVVTAEPYYAVSQLGNVVVMENVVRKDTKGKVEEMDAKFDLLPRGQYTLNKSPSDLQSTKMDKKTPVYLFQARNAVNIAKAAGADTLAVDSFNRAQSMLKQAEDDLLRKKNKKLINGEAREAIQTAEDARLIAIKRKGEQDVTTKLDQAQSAVQTAEGARMAAMGDAAKSQLLASQAEAARNAAMIDTAKAKAQVAQSEQEKTQLRGQLRNQLNAVLETRDSARGLIVNMSDVLFSIGKYDLKPPVREKLAKVAGIVSSHPGLKLAVEGHTDNVGSDAFNQTLSEQRAGAVRDYLVQQGIAQDTVSSAGLGKTRPIATNDSGAGRQQNRRVEIVVSGEGIGNTNPAQ